MSKLTLKLFMRMLRSGEFNLLLSALVLATAAITAISIFVERIENTLFNEASNFIAADAKISGSADIESSWIKEAHKLGLEVATYRSFNAMVFSDHGLKLGRVKAVSEGYPLKGELVVEQKIVSASRNERIPVKSGPSIGELWLAPRLFNELNIKLGDEVRVGKAAFKVSARLISEPDSASTQFGLAPRVMMHAADVEDTGALQLGSRVQHALLVAAEQSAIEEFKANIEAQLGDHFRWISPREGNRAISSSLDRAQRFLLLAGSLSVVLSGLAIAIAAQRFAKKQSSQVALLKCFGSKPKDIQLIYSMLLVFLGSLGVLLGCLLGWSLHHILLIVLSTLLPDDLGSSSLNAFSIGALTCFVSLFAFAAPPILALKNISPLQILKKFEVRFFALHLNIIGAILAISGLCYFFSRSIQISAIVLLGLLTCILVSTVFTYFILKLSKALQQGLKGTWRLGLGNLQRQPAQTGLQIFVFASITLLVLVLVQVRTNLINNWQPALENTPNHFVFNIFSNELDEVKKTLDSASVETSNYYPMTRGRLVAINDEAITPKIKDKNNADYERELNLTWSSTLGPDNVLLEGQWWVENSSSNQQLLVSAEQEYAEGLGLKLEDKLSFSIAGTKVHARLVSIRSVEWDSMNPNFYMIFNQAVADSISANWITSFYLDGEQSAFLTELSKRFPGLSIIELDQTLKQIKSVAARVSLAVEFILLLVLTASLLVVLTSIQSSIEERVRETALLRSFGASRASVQRVILIEFGVVGFLAGLFACAGAELSLYFIQTKVFDMPYEINYLIWLGAAPLSALIIACAGYMTTVSTSFVPPMRALKEGI